MTEKVPLSVAIITKDEEKNLPECISSVDFADQVVVVDSGSLDKTLEIALSHGCDVYDHPWEGFGPQKQFAIDKCRNQWILILDADERIPKETAIAIREIVLKNPDRVAGFRFPRKNYFQGKWIRHMGWWPDRIVRLFRKGHGRMSPANVHESVLLDGPVEDLKVPIVHLTESNLSSVLLKIDRYSTLGAQESFRLGKRSSVWYAAFRAKLAFFQNYFLKLGFLDGRQGFVLSITDAVNKFFKYAKLSEMKRETESKKINQ
jgi:(heptosyl)LPS beta-1,4-glucosyltransferase